MKVFRELTIAGKPEELDKLLSNLEQHLSNGWTRDLYLEKQVNNQSLNCFTCTENGFRPACALWLAKTLDNQIYVSNIVPKSLHKLSYDQYNSVLEDFYQSTVVLAVRDLDVTVNFTAPDRSIESLLKPKVLELLFQFSRAANKSTGSSHPYDQKRWYDFLVNAHKEKTSLDSFTLRRWLVEEEGWSEDIALELASEYEAAMSLLNYYDHSA